MCRPCGLEKFQLLLESGASRLRQRLCRPSGPEDPKVKLFQGTGCRSHQQLLNDAAFVGRSDQPLIEALVGEVEAVRIEP